MRERSNSLFELDGELVSYIRWFGPIETAAAQVVWSAHALVRPSGAEHVDDHLIVMGFEVATGLVEVGHQFGPDQLAEAMGAFEELRAAAQPDLMNGAATVAGGVNTQARAGHIDMVRQWCSNDLRVIGTDGEPVLDGVDGLADPVVAARAGFGVTRRTVLAVRGAICWPWSSCEMTTSTALDATGSPSRSWTISAASHSSPTSPPTMPRCVTVDLLDDRWTQTGGSSSIEREAVMWKLARAFRHEDEAILRECLDDDCVMVDRRQLGWPTLSKEEWIDVVREGAGGRGVFVVSQVYRMDVSGYAFEGVNLSMSREGDPVEMLRQFGDRCHRERPGRTRRGLRSRGSRCRVGPPRRADCAVADRGSRRSLERSRPVGSSSGATLHRAEIGGLAGDARSRHRGRGSTGTRRIDGCRPRRIAPLGSASSVIASSRRPSRPSPCAVIASRSIVGG